MVKEEEIKEWLIGFFSKNVDISKYDDKKLLSCNYIEEGFIDSLRLINLIVEIENKFQIKFSNDTFQDRSFTTIGGLAKIVHQLIRA
ncbi:MAG: acyl carrier protein [Rickettsiaceae bacterium]